MIFNRPQLYIYTSFPSHSKDVSLPQDMQRAMAAEAEATREANAKVCVHTLSGEILPLFSWILSSLAKLKQHIDVSLQVISANGERSASEKLRQAADIIDESPASLQLRYLQTLNTISAENNHTYVFPLPIDLMMKFFSKQ